MNFFLPFLSAFVSAELITKQGNFLNSILKDVILIIIHWQKFWSKCKILKKKVVHLECGRSGFESHIYVGTSPFQCRWRATNFRTLLILDEI